MCKGGPSGGGVFFYYVVCIGFSDTAYPKLPIAILH